MMLPVLALRGVGKRFGSVQALAAVDLEVHRGEVLALVGDNGAGKSTLIKVIAGVDPADAGVVEWEGRAVEIRRPHDAQALGIATVYQDLALCDNLDVASNLFLGRELTVAGVLDEVEMERRARDLLRTLSVRIPSVRAQVASLSGGQRQAVAIARSLLEAPGSRLGAPNPGTPSPAAQSLGARKPGATRVVLLDEPTAALGVEQTAQVLELIERLRERGLAVILISHNLADVLAVADRIAVLRLGRNAGCFQADEVTREALVAAITGVADGAAARREGRRPGGDGAATAGSGQVPG